jgi:hypothetical protein
VRKGTTFYYAKPRKKVKHGLNTDISQRLPPFLPHQTSEKALVLSSEAPLRLSVISVLSV